MGKCLAQSMSDQGLHGQTRRGDRRSVGLERCPFANPSTDVPCEHGRLTDRVKGYIEFTRSGVSTHHSGYVERSTGSRRYCSPTSSDIGRQPRSATGLPSVMLTRCRVIQELDGRFDGLAGTDLSKPLHERR